MDSMSHRAKFHCDRLNCCLDMAICDFQNTASSPSCIFKMPCWCKGSKYVTCQISWRWVKLWL